MIIATLVPVCLLAALFAAATVPENARDSVSIGRDADAPLPERECDECKGTIKFAITPVGTWVPDAANTLYNVVWGSDPKQGECDESECEQSGDGCSDSFNAQFGYNSAGYEVYVLPPTTPPTPPVSGINLATANDSLIWKDTPCGEWGAGGGSQFSIFALGVQVALVQVKGGCKNCSGDVPDW